MSIEKQLVMNFYVNNAPMPMDVINVIKSFVFMDKTTAFIKEKKKEVVEKFARAIYSRANTSPWWVTETSESWIFMFDDQNPIQSGNCMDCGEYFNHPKPVLRCNCPRHSLVLMPEDLDYEAEFQQEWDFDDDPGADYP
jgi:hypothetical protein